MTDSIRTIAKKIPGARELHSGLAAVKENVRKLFFRLGGGTRYTQRYYGEALLQALDGGASPRSDISDHLGTIFHVASSGSPRLMVELGTRGGESTRALLAAASVTRATLLSIDVDDCSQLSVPFPERWHFIRADDVEFGKSGFASWCRGRSLEPMIDVLFIDTSHEYEHTRRELEVWSPHLRPGGTMLLHDTNMGTGLFGRNDGSVGIGWDNARGVIRALEEFLGRSYDERSYFTDVAGPYTVIHYPNCNGLTVVRKR